MIRWLAQFDTNANPVVPPASIPVGISAAVAAQSLGWPDGTWREITDVEAAELQKPTREEQQIARKAEILARLAAIDADTVRPLRAIANGGGSDFDTQKLAGLDAEAATLRTELAGLGQAG